MELVQGIQFFITHLPEYIFMSSLTTLPAALALRGGGRLGYKMTNAAVQQCERTEPSGATDWLIAYNAYPRYCSCQNCWFGALQISMRPFFMPGRFNSIL